MARIPYLLLCWCASLTAASAQTTGVLTGRVVRQEGAALIGATIRLEGTPIGGLSKAPLGVFTIAGIRPGTYTAIVGGIGSQTIRREVAIAAGMTTNVGVLFLKASELSGREIVVRDSRVIEREQVSTTRSIPMGSERSGGGMAIRGGRATETTVRVDGVEVTDPYVGGMGATSASIYPTVSTLTVQEVQIIPNPVSAEFGDIISGTVDSRGETKRAIDADVSGENYAKIYENQFQSAHVSPLSTFSIDVDRASYSNIRRFLTAGIRPPADAVRIEEMINYFDYGYSDPDDEHPFRISTEMTDCPWDRSHRLVRIGLQGRHVAAEVMPPTNLTFLIDVSGSMSSPDKLPLLQRSLRVLVERLRPEDNVAIVVYAGAAGAVLPMTSGAKKTDILAAIDRLSAGGSTAGGAGIELAYKIALDDFNGEGNNRVVLATDGDFNVGVSSETDLVALIEEKRKHGVFLTVLGFGTGNYQDAKMEQLADKGNGNYAYIDNIAEAEKVFVAEMGATLLTIAKDVKIQVVFAPERVESYRLIGYENRVLANEDFDNDIKDAGELGAGHTVTALYEIVPRGAQSASLEGWVGRKDTLDMPGDWQADELLRVRLRYKLPDSDVSTLIEGPVVDRGVGFDRASEDFRFAAAVAQFGMLLRDSRHKGTSSYDDVLRLATASKGVDAVGYRAEFITLVEAARKLPATASR